MFIERSAARIRLMRTLFVLLGILPCAGLCGWAAVRHSGAHRQAIELRCEQVIGLPVAIGRIEHVRPNVMRLHDCRLSSASGHEVLRATAIEVESLASELRVTLGRLDGTPELARVLARLAGEWLRQPARFPVDCVVDVSDFSWRQRRPSGAIGAPLADPASAGEQRARSLHVECVAANGSRAIRVRRTVDEGQAADEVRVVAGHLAGADGQDAGSAPGGAEPVDHVGATGLEVNGTITQPLPLAVFEALTGLQAGALPLGDDAVVSGTVAALLDDGQASGSAQGRVDRIDLAAASRHLPHRVSGEAVVAVERLAWSRGRITACECECSVSRGRLSQRLLDACVSALGCRPGPAYRSLAREEVRVFDDASALLRIDSAGIDLRAAPERAGSLVRTQGLSIVDEPRMPVPLDRLAWLLAPPGSVAVPASAATAWLLGFFTIDVPVPSNGTGNAVGVSPGNTPAKNGGSPSGQAVRPLRRSEF